MLFSAYFCVLFKPNPLSKACGFMIWLHFIRTVEDVLQFLSDSSDKEYPIWRDAQSEKDEVYTEVMLCYRYTCFLHYFALFGGLGLNR